MLRGCVIAALAACGQALCASDSICHIAPLPPAAGALCYHTRIEAPRWSAARHTLYWNYRSDSCHRRIEVDVPAVADADAALPSAVRYSVYTRRHGRDSLVASGRFASEYGTGRRQGFSTVLRTGPGGAAIEMGAKKADFSLAVPFDTDSCGSVGTAYPAGTELLRHTLRYRPAAEAAYSRFADTDSLAAHIAAGGDPSEGIWTYLDRNTDPLQARPGGSYNLATVRNSDGTYAIVYIGGAAENASAWKPLQLKGALTPTPFRNHFDLNWTDAHGNDVSAEASADITVDGLVLELNFPLIGASMRFRRVAPQPVPESEQCR